MNRLFILLPMLFLSVENLSAQNLQTDISVHDPVIIKQDSLYYIFCTGKGINKWSSTDMINWKHEEPVFAEAPQWAIDAIPGFNGDFWAPDISFYNGLYYLYYSVSAFGKNTSAIGVATNKTLHADDPDYHWVDHGMVIQSYPGKTNWNAIDPNLITDKKGTPYLAFGSFWEGLKLVKLKQDRLSIDQNPAHLPTIASRKKDEPNDRSDTDNYPVDAGDNAIEGAFIFPKNNYYYLFASIDYCCKGPESTYKMIIGRSKKLQGPYLDEAGLPLVKGGGTILLQGDEHWHGVGHNAVFTDQNTDYIIFHGYDATDQGIPKLRIEKLSWDSSGWPVVEISK
ncbi:MAG: family 43 glycosylhydrolase [Janthinobacterium lividum]